MKTLMHQQEVVLPAYLDPDEVARAAGVAKRGLMRAYQAAGVAVVHRGTLRVLSEQLRLQAAEVYAAVIRFRTRRSSGIIEVDL